MRNEKNQARTRTLSRSVFVSTVVASVAVAHLVFPGRIDAVFLALLALALVPWLAPLLESLKFADVEIVFRELERQLAETKGEARSSRRMVETLAQGILTDRESIATDAEVSPDEEFDGLIAEYKLLQKNAKRGPTKTAKLTRIMSRMIVLGPRLRSLDVREALKGKDQGKRVAAYAMLYARPDGALLRDLVDAVTGSKQRPFAQYWGIKALGKVLPVSTPADVQDARFRLEEFQARQVPQGSDRHRELSVILRGFAGGQPSPDARERRVP